MNPERMHQVGAAAASAAPGLGVWLWHALGNVVPVLVGVATLAFTFIQIARGYIALQEDLEKRRIARAAAVAAAIAHGDAE